METRETRKATAWRRGWIIFVALSILTAVEFGVSAALANPLPYLTIIALIKAGLIAAYFMRLADLTVLWRGEEMS
jgi:membrane protein YdbS with pleckstrin-like domain